MVFTKTKFALAWFATPAQFDWDNLIASNCKRVLIGYQVARTQPNVLARLAGIGRRIVVRVEQENQQPPADVAHELSLINHIVGIDAVILGCEPDSGIDFTYRDTNDPNAWGQDKAYASAQRVNMLTQAVRGLGLKSVAPAMTWPDVMISEDGKSQPGRTTFREIVARHYNEADGVASHCGYVLGWDGNIVNPIRFKNGLKRNVEEWHKPLWIDECTFPTDDDVRQMQCAIDLAELIMKHPAGERVEMLCPFVGEGFVNGSWDKRYLIRDIRAYELLGRWLTT